MREYNSLMISSEQSDFISLKDVKSCLMLVIHLQKAGMIQYFGYLGRNYEKLSLDIMREYHSLMISSARSDLISLKDVILCLKLVIYLQKAGMKQY
jgi:hypothetical protein